MTNTPSDASKAASADPRFPHGRLTVVLGAVTGIAAMPVVPYVVASTGVSLHTRGLPIGVVLVLSGAQSTVLGSLLAWIGLRLGGPLGLDAPPLRAWSGRRSLAAETHRVVAVSGGIVASLVIVALDVTLFRRLLSPSDLHGGKLYRRYGLEHAMVAHFCGDVVLHGVIGG